MTANPVTVTATRLFDPADVAPGRHAVAVAAGPHADLAVLPLDDPPGYRRASAAGASIPKLRADAPNRYRIDHYRAGGRSSVTLPPTRDNSHHVRPPDGGRLLVRGRAAGPDDRNARLYGQGGTPAGGFQAGDGARDVQATGGGRVWVSYFDGGGGDADLGRSGLACLGPTGRVLARSNDLAAAGAAPAIADCYAPNVPSDREAWACCHTDFPLVRVTDGAVAEVRRAAVAGSPAFAVPGRRVVFAGGYARRGRLHLADPAAPRVRELVPTDGRGHALAPSTAIGRAGRLYLRSGAGLYVIDLGGLTGAARSPSPDRPTGIRP